MKTIITIILSLFLVSCTKEELIVPSSNEVEQRIELHLQLINCSVTINVDGKETILGAENEHNVYILRYKSIKTFSIFKTTYYGKVTASIHDYYKMQKTELGEIKEPTKFTFK